MKLTLIHGKWFNSWEALGLGYLASYIRKHEPNCEITFWQGCFDSDDAIIADASTADIVAFSNTSPTVTHSVNLGRAIKKENPNVWTVTGGYHPSAVGRKALVENAIDQVVIGEGEDALLRIMRGDRRPVITGRMMKFDELEWPDRTLLKNERCIDVAEELTGVRITSVHSHRGCVFRCKFCADGAVKVLFPGTSWKHDALIRYRDPEDIVDEMAYIAKKYNLGLIKKAAPTWNLSRAWVHEFCKAKIRKGVEVPFYPAIHAGIMDDETAQLMREAGCVQAALGIESGSDKILREVGKGTTKKSIRRCVTALQKAGIAVRGYLIFGMPEEDWGTVRETIEFVDSLNLAEAGATILAPYPGSVYFNEEEHGHILWDQVDEYQNDFWHSNYLSNAELKEAQALFADKFQSTLCWHQKEVMKTREAQQIAA